MNKLTVLLFVCAFVGRPPVAPAAELPGKVTSVDGSAVRVEIAGDSLPRPGDKAEIVCIIPEAGVEAAVAQGEVTEVKDNVAVVTVSHSSSAVKPGHTARIHSDHPAPRLAVSASPAVATPATPLPAPASAAPPKPLPFFVNSIGTRLTLIPAGQFVMGNRDSANRPAADDPPHPVRITRPFYMSLYETTVREFFVFAKAVPSKMPWGMGFDPQTQSFIQGNDMNHFSWQNTGWKLTDNHPVVNVSWNDASAYCRWLSEREHKTYRLPTEAEWEYACRAGTTTAYYSGDDEGTLQSVANVADFSFKSCLAVFRQPGFRDYTARWNDGFPFTAPVGLFQPNRFGLYDMHGNVQEWCSDWYGKDYYRVSPPDDPRGPSAGQTRVKRGGDWVDYPANCRSSFRRSEIPPEGRCLFVGFRVVCEAN